MILRRHWLATGKSIPQADSARVRVAVYDHIFWENRAWFRFTFRWRDPETSNTLTQAGMQSYRIEDGKLAETWIVLQPTGSSWPDPIAQERWTSPPPYWDRTSRCGSVPKYSNAGGRLARSHRPVPRSCRGRASLSRPLIVSERNWCPDSLPRMPKQPAPLQPEEPTEPPGPDLPPVREPPAEEPDLDPIKPVQEPMRDPVPPPNRMGARHPAPDTRTHGRS
jgi:hypothetical protein